MQVMIWQNVRFSQPHSETVRLSSLSDWKVRRKAEDDGGALFLEIGWDEAEAVRALFGGGRVLRDLNGRDRVIEIQG